MGAEERLEASRLDWGDGRAGGGWFPSFFTRNVFSTGSALGEGDPTMALSKVNPHIPPAVARLGISRPNHRAGHRIRSQVERPISCFTCKGA